MKSADPSTPVRILGFSGLPNAGDEFLVMESDRAAKELSAGLNVATTCSDLTLPYPLSATYPDRYAAWRHGPRSAVRSCGGRGRYPPEFS